MKALLYCLLASTASAQILPPSRSYDWGNAIWRAPSTEGRAVHQTYTVASPPSVSTVNAAIASCPSNRVIEFETGTYAMNGQITLNRNGVTLRGKAGHRVIFSNAGGAGSTMVKFHAGYPDDLGIGQDVTGNISKGSTSFSTVGPAVGIAADDIIQLDQLEDDPAGLVDASGNSGHCNWCARASGNRAFSQTLRVLSVTGGNVITFEPPLALDFLTSQQPQVVEHRNTIRYSGLENIILHNAGASRDTVMMQGAWRCFIKDCELINSVRRHVWQFGGAQCSFTGSTFRQGNGADWSSAYTSDRAYGLFVGQHTSFTLIENCIFRELSYPIALEGASMGTVIGYNFITNVMNTTLDTGKPSTGNHGAHPAMALVEGNFFAARISMDSYWGSSSHWPFLRNRVFIVGNQAGQQVTQYWVVFDLWKKNRYHSVIGNIFGIQGLENNLDVPSGASINSGSTIKAIRRRGADNANHTTWSGYDPQVAATLLWHGNWLSFPVGVQWDPAIADRTIPSSYYLSAKPSFQGNLPWPSHDPLNPAMATATNLAAGYRHYFGTNPPSGGVTPPQHQPPGPGAFTSGRVSLQ